MEMFQNQNHLSQIKTGKECNKSQQWLFTSVHFSIFVTVIDFVDGIMSCLRGKVLVATTTTMITTTTTMTMMMTIMTMMMVGRTHTGSDVC